jgi:polar amino acid transport system substrate-binding protein
MKSNDGSHIPIPGSNVTKPLLIWLAVAGLRVFPPAFARFTTVLLMASALFPLGAAAAGPVLRVGVTANSPPMIFREGKNMAGVEADLARSLGAQLGREVQFIEVPWEDLIDALSEGKIDIIMSSMSVTRARQFRVAFAEPYLRVAQMALVRAPDKYILGPFPLAMTKKTIGVKKATTGDLLVQQEFPKVKRKYFKSGEESAKALTKGSIDLFVDDSTLIWYLAGVYEADGLVVAPMTLSDEVLAWSVNRSNDPLLASVNDFLKKIKASGELDRVLHRWIPKLQ